MYSVIDTLHRIENATSGRYVHELDMKLVACGMALVLNDERHFGVLTENNG